MRVSAAFTDPACLPGTQRLHERADLRLAVRTGGDVELHQVEALDAEAGIGAAHGLDAAEHERGADQHHDTACDLCRQEYAAQPQPRTPRPIAQG